MSTQPPADDAWPRAEAPTMVASHETVVRDAPAPPPYYPPEEPPPSRQIGQGMLLAIAVLILVAAGLAIAWFLTHRHHGHGSATTTVVVTSNGAAAAAPGKVAVPRVVALTEQQALTRLAQVGLRPKEVFKPASSGKKGTVTAQRPKEATTLAKGSQVTIVIDSGAPKVAVPSVKGLSLSDAQKKLDALGLDSTTTQVTSSQAAGTVVDQAPAAGGKLAKGSTVTLSVAKAAPVSVPAETGQQQSAATSALQAAGLQAHVVTVPSAKPSGQVVAQNPAAGSKLAKGGTVRLNVSDGSQANSKPAPAPATTTSSSATTTSSSATTTSAAKPAPAPAQPTTASVPDVTQSQLQAAVQQLNSAGFLASIQYIPGNDPLGTILQQSPSGGGTAKTRSHVTINASSGPGQKQQETVPDATGQTLKQAVSTMNGSQLRLIFVKLPVTDKNQVGKIVEQTPLAGKQAPQNAQILVYLGVLKQ